MKGQPRIEDVLEFAFLNIDKPSGPTSFQVSEYVMGILGARKASHLGTLDPQVSGVLPIAVNRACRLAKYLMRKDKSYVGVMRLHEDIDDKVLKESMDNLIGRIKQMPPVRSSVKRAERERDVYSFKILERAGKDVVFECEVEAGTYVRTLIHDLGKSIGGAHMLELRRTCAGIFDENKSFTLYDLEKACEAWKSGKEKAIMEMIIPADEIVRKAFPVIEINDAHIDRILKGKPIHRKDVLKMKELEKNSFVGVFCKNQFVEIARVVNAGDVIAVPDFVFN
jgi:H/ACA ribonucleoprotein complex subunit 4